MRKRRSNRQRGFVLVLMGVSAAAVFGGLGLSVDLGRLYITRSELQTWCDSAALGAALQLDGTSNGLDRAKAAVTGSTNSYNFNTMQVNSPEVEFSSNGTSFSSTPGSAANQRYVRVTATASVSLYFLPLIVGRSSQNVVGRAVAGQIPQSGFKRGLGPFTAVAQDMSSQTFGLQEGMLYDLQWPAYNGSRAGCGPDTPEECFVKAPCSGDNKHAKAAVTQYWGASINGYWGDNANSTINAEILNLIQLQPVNIHDYIVMSSGNKNAEAAALDARVNQDVNLVDNTKAGYLAHEHNGRRFLPIPVVNPTAAGTEVVGYGSFLLISDGSPSNYYRSGHGNDPFCAIYVGAYTQGSTGPGVEGTGAFKVQLVQ
ncbi:MAG: hypothetical protein HY820_35620 [Acidobacteria bacterium]|nr:hypothetical protein [Acidobacteriota bacterium]